MPVNPSERVPSPIPPDASTVTAPANAPGATGPYVPPPGKRREDLPAVPGYEVHGEMGRGGMGVVYQARHLALNRLVALKMIRAGQADPQERARFRAEAEAVARLQHPNIVAVHEIGEHQGQPFCALEFVRGGSLNRRLAGTPIGPIPAARLTASLARAMAAVHQLNLVHRDLKPANVLLQGDVNAPLEQCVPKVADFGLAKFLDDDSGQTQEGAIMGTPSYMAPEQALGQSREVGPAADIYALGAILYECLTGRPPFKGASKLETLEQVRSQEPVPVRQMVQGVPRDLETICLKCLRKDPARRYGSAQELAEDLERFLDGRPVLARPASVWERTWKWARRRPAAAALVVVCALLLIGVVGGGYAYTRLQGEHARDLEGRYEELRLAHLQTEDERNRAIQAEADAREAEKTARTKGAEALREKQEAEAQRRQADEARERARRSILHTQLQKVAGVFEQNPDEGLELLNDAWSCPLDLRDFSWRLSYLLCKRDRPLSLPGWGIQPELKVAVSPGGEVLATAAWGGADLWDLRTGEKRPGLRRTGGETMSPQALAFSADGKTLAVGSAHQMRAEVWLWDVTTGQERPALRGGGDAVTALAFSPDGLRLAVASGAQSLRIWDLVSGKEGAALTGHTLPITSLVFTPDGKTLASGAGMAPKDSGELKLWDVDARRERASAKFASPVHALVAMPDGRTLISAGDLQEGDVRKTGEVQFWDLATGEKKTALRAHEDTVTAIAVSKDGTLLATGSAAQNRDRQRISEVKVWDMPRAQVRTTFHGPQVWVSNSPMVQSLRFTPNGKSLVALQFGQKPKVWNLAPGAEIVSLERGRIPVYPPDSSGLCYLEAEGGDAILRNGETQEEIRRFHHGPGLTGLNPLGLTGLAPSRDGRLLATRNISKPGELPSGVPLRLWDLTTGKELILPQSVGSGFVTFSDPATAVAVYAQDNTVHVWNVADKREMGFVQLANKFPHQFAVAPTGTTLATLELGTQVVHLWDVPSGKERRKLTLSGACDLLEMSPDGKILVTGSGGDWMTLSLWDAVTGDRLLSAEPGGMLPGVAFSPDGRTLAVIVLRLAGKEASVWLELWDVAGKQKRLSVRNPEASPAGLHARVNFTPDGKKLLCAFDRRIDVWDTETRGERAVLPWPRYFGQASVAFLGDGNTFVGGGSLGVELWDVRTGQSRASLEGDAFTASADGSTLATWTAPRPDRPKEESQVLIWDASTGRPRSRLELPKRLLAVELGPNGQLAAIAREGTGGAQQKWSSGSTVELWDTATGKSIATLLETQTRVEALRFSPDGKGLVTGDDKGAVKLWDVADRKEIKTLPGDNHINQPQLGFADDGSVLITRKKDQTGREGFEVWDLASGTPRELPGFSGGLAHVATEGTVLAGVELSGEIVLHNLTGSRQPTRIPGIGLQELSKLEILHGGQTVVAVAKGGKVYVWDVATGKRRLLETHQEDIYRFGIAVSRDGQTLALGTTWWDLAAAKEETARGLTAAEDVRTVAFSAGGGRFVLGGGDGVVNLQELSSGRVLTSFKGHQGDIFPVALSPDGKVLASAGEDRAVRLWDLTSNKELATLEGHQARILALAFSPDSATLASAGRDRVIRVWDVGLRKERAHLEGHEGTVTAVAFSPDGLTLASGSADRTVRLWRLATGQQFLALKEHTSAVQVVCFSPDGTRLATGTREGVVTLWDATTGRRQVWTQTAEARALAFHRDGKSLAVGTVSGEVVLWDLAEERRTVRHQRPVSGLAFLSSEQALAVGSADGAITLWDLTTLQERPFRMGLAAPGPWPVDPFGGNPGRVPLLSTSPTDYSVVVRDQRTGEVRFNLAGHAAPISALVASADNRTAASGSLDTTVRLWDLVNGKQLFVCEGHTLGLSALVLAPDGKTVASGSFDTTVRLWDAATGKHKALLRGHSSTVTGLTFNADGSLLASRGADGSIRLWDVVAGKERTTLTTLAKGVSLLEFVAGGKTLVAQTGAGTMLWDTADGKLRTTLKNLTQGAFSPDGKLLAGAVAEGVKVWDLETGEEQRTLPKVAPGVLLSRVRFHADGKSLLGETYDGVVQQVWDLATGKATTPFIGSRWEILAVALSPDGKTLVTAGGGFNQNDNGAAGAAGRGIGEVRVWDFPSGKERATVEGHKNVVYAVAFAPDGKTVASCSHDGLVQLFDPATGKVTDRLQSYPGSVYAATFTADGKTLVLGRGRLTPQGTWLEGDVALWDLAAGKERVVLTGHRTGVRSLALSPDGKTLASGGFDGVLKLWDLSAGKELRTVSAHSNRINAMRFLTDGKTLASASEDGVVRLWDSETGKEQAALRDQLQVPASLLPLPDEKTLAVGGNWGSFLLWDLKTQKPRFKAPPQTSAVLWGLVLSPDGKTLITGGSDRTVRFWDAATGVRKSLP